MQQFKAGLFSGRSLFALLTLVLLALMIEPTQGQSDHHVGLVVRHGDGEIVTQCVDIGAPSVSGYDVLTASGLNFSPEVQSMGVIICSLDGEGCTFPNDPCFCQCMGSPCTYWSYWQQENDRWVYSNVGASSSTVQAGSVEGWSWGSGTINASADYPPPDVSYLEICEPQMATATVVARSTLDAAATVTAVAQQSTTAPPAPTATATPTSNPGDPPLITYLAADRERIRAGESAVLTWETRGAGSVVLESTDAEQTVSLSGSLTLVPEVTTVYRLIARNAGGEDRVDVMITVDPPEPTATPTSTPASTMTPTMTPTTAQVATATPTVIPAQATVQTIVTEAPTEAPLEAPTGAPVTTAPSEPPTVPPTVVIIDPASPTPVLLATLTPTPTPTTSPTTAPVATPTEAAVALARPDLGQAESRNVLNAPGAEAENLAEDQVEQTTASESALTALRGPFGAMLFVVAAPLALAALALLVLRVRKREGA